MRSNGQNEVEKNQEVTLSLNYFSTLFPMSSNVMKSCLMILIFLLTETAIVSSYRLVRKKYDSSKSKKFINEKFKEIFYFFTCILPDYVAHDITKEF